MKCPTCKSGSGARVDMVLGAGRPGLWFCPSDPNHQPVLLVDVGYAPIVVPVVVDRSPFRVIEELAHHPVKQQPNPQPPRPCEWTRCGKVFTPTHPHQKYCGTPCAVQVAAARDRERRLSERSLSPLDAEATA